MQAAHTVPVSELDPARLAEVMRAFANPVRIEILRQLRQPRTLAEIRVHPHRRDRGRSERAVSVATVRHHVAQLFAIGAVRRRRLLRDGEHVEHYVVDHRQVFTLAEELRMMGRIRPQPADVLDGTVPAEAPTPPVGAPGPKLVLVNGTYEGTVIALRDGPGVPAAWPIGRRAGCAVCLDYDPYVSLAQAEIRREGGRFHLRDLASARNRTRVNWEEMAPGGARGLQSGDLVGVGRSLLLFLDR